jgi:hypothetical protein
VAEVHTKTVLTVFAAGSGDHFGPAEIGPVEAGEAAAIDFWNSLDEVATGSGDEEA